MSNTIPTPFNDPSNVLKPINPVGIVSYGAYIPRYRLPVSLFGQILSQDGER